METSVIDYGLMKEKALEQLRSGKSLYGKDGAFAPLLKSFLEAALQAELEQHLDPSERNTGNRKKGKTSKELKTSSGTLLLETPRDRMGSFEPEMILKRQTILAERLEGKIIGMYGLGMSLRDISQHIKDMYDTEISPATLSAITDKVIPQIKEWQAWPLESLYTIVWLDALHYKVRDGGQVVSRAVYNVLRINRYGKKTLLGMYVSESEGANFWLSVLTDLKNRGLGDILIACIDNLKGFCQAINTIFPSTEVQSCIIHQIRNSLKYVASKDQKFFMQDLKPVYQATNKDQAEYQLAKLEEKWMKKYPIVLKSWQHNWEKLSAYFKYDEPVRRLIYTTNAIEGFHRQVRKVTKTKGAFSSDMALIKLIYLAYRNISRKWTMPLPNWGLTAAQLAIWFPGRMILDLQ